MKVQGRFMLARLIDNHQFLVKTRLDTILTEKYNLCEDYFLKNFNKDYYSVNSITKQCALKKIPVTYMYQKQRKLSTVEKN